MDVQPVPIVRCPEDRAEWQRLVTDMMHVKHGPAFFQVDPAGRGDKGCDGWVEGLMLACYGGTTPSSPRLLPRSLKTSQRP